MGLYVAPGPFLRQDHRLFTDMLTEAFAVGLIEHSFHRYMDQGEAGLIASHGKIMAVSKGLTFSLNGAVGLAVCAAFLQEFWHPFWAVQSEKNCDSMRSFLNSFVRLLLRRFIRQSPILIFFLSICSAYIPPGTLSVVQDIGSEQYKAPNTFYSYIEPPFYYLSIRICQIIVIIQLLIWLSLKDRLPSSWEVCYDANIWVSWPEYLLTSTLKTDLEYPWFLTLLSQSLHRRFKRTGSMNDLLRATEATKHSLLFQSLVIKRSRRMFLVRLLQEQFERTGSIDIINLAIALNEEVLVATPHTDKYFTKCLANLAVALKMRFDIVGSPDDINRAFDLSKGCDSIL